MLPLSIFPCKIELVLITTDTEKEDPSGCEIVEGGYLELKKKPVCQNGLYYDLRKQTNVPNRTHDVHHRVPKLQLFQHRSVQAHGFLGKTTDMLTYSDSEQTHASQEQGCGSFQQLSSLFLPSPPCE